MNTTPRRSSTSTATVVAGSGPATPAAAVTDDSRVATGVVSGGIFAWGIDATFLGHLASPAVGGQATGTDGADFVDGEFIFPVNAENPTIGDRGNAVIALDGRADLKAYEGPGPDGGGGPVLEATGTAATLTGGHALSGSRNGGTEPTVGGTGDDVPLITFTLAEPLDPATGVSSAMEVGAFAAQGVADSPGRHAVGAGMCPAGLDLSSTERDEPARTPTDGSSSVGRGLAASFAVPGKISAPVAGAQGAIPGQQLLV